MARVGEDRVASLGGIYERGIDLRLGLILIEDSKDGAIWIAAGLLKAIQINN